MSVPPSTLPSIPQAALLLPATQGYLQTAAADMPVAYAGPSYGRSSHGMTPLPGTMLLPVSAAGAESLTGWQGYSHATSMPVAIPQSSIYDQQADVLGAQLGQALVLGPHSAEYQHGGPSQYYQPRQSAAYGLYDQPQSMVYMGQMLPGQMLPSHRIQPTEYPDAFSSSQASTSQGQGRLPSNVKQQHRKRSPAGQQDKIKKTVYISYIDQQVTEEALAMLFEQCGTVVDCRVCGDPNSAMRFAFIEFTEETAVFRAMQKTGTVLGSTPLRVLPSKTAIVPVNSDLMAQTDHDVERCSRTVYVANIDKKVDKNDVKGFFEQLCGKVTKLRSLGDYAHSTRIAFIEFEHPSGAQAALNCSGALLGALPIRVAPSKTPVRSDAKDMS